MSIPLSPSSSGYMLVAILLLSMSQFVYAQTVPSLGAASNYVLFSANDRIVNDGPSSIHGNIGTSGGRIRGIASGAYGSAIHVADRQSAVVANDLQAAWNEANSMACTMSIETLLGEGEKLASGTYCVDVVDLSGNLVLDGAGNSLAVFIIKVNGQLNATAGTKVVLTNNARAANIYWIVNDDVDILDSSDFKGTIISRGLVYLHGGVALEGRAFSIGGPIGTDSVTITVPDGAPAAHLDVSSSVRDEEMARWMNSHKEFTATAAASGNQVDNGAALSSAEFIDGLTLDGVVEGFVGNNTPVTISWSHHPEFGGAIDVEYSLDNGVNWNAIVTVPATAEQSARWVTPAIGYTGAALVRVRGSATGVRAVSDAFAIDTPITVGSIMSYPNPAGSIATLQVTLSAESVVTVTIWDALGNQVTAAMIRQLSSGESTLPIDVSALETGAYLHRLEVGGATHQGRLMVAR